MTRREWLALWAAAGLRASEPPATPVAVQRCRTYDNETLIATLSKMFDQLGGLDRLVRNKTVTVKLNLTGSPALKLQGKPLGVTHYTHPRVVGAVAHLMGRAGARRIRFVESCWGTAGPLEEYMLDSGWNVRGLQSAAAVCPKLVCLHKQGRSPFRCSQVRVGEQHQNDVTAAATHHRRSFRGDPSPRRMGPVGVGRLRLVDSPLSKID